MASCPCRLFPPANGEARRKKPFVARRHSTLCILQEAEFSLIPADQQPVSLRSDRPGKPRQPAFRSKTTRALTSSCVSRWISLAGWLTPKSDSRSTNIDLLLTYYGDDFTGSTDVLEALYSGGIEAVLFVTPPSSELLRRYRHVRAFG